MQTVDLRVQNKSGVKRVCLFKWEEYRLHIRDALEVWKGCNWIQMHYSSWANSRCMVRNPTSITVKALLQSQSHITLRPILNSSVKVHSEISYWPEEQFFHSHTVVIHMNIHTHKKNLCITSRWQCQVMKHYAGLSKNEKSLEKLLITY